MSIIMKCPDIALGLAGNGFAVGKSGSAGSIVFTQNLPQGGFSTLNDGFYASAFFYLPGSVTPGALYFLNSQFWQNSGTNRGVLWSVNIDGSDSKFQILFNNDASNSGTYTATVPTSSVTNNAWHHILIAHSGNSGYGTKAYFDDSAVTAAETGSLTNLTAILTDDSMIGGFFDTSGNPVGSANGIAYQNIYFSRYGADDPATESNRRKFINADGTPASGTPILPSVASAGDGLPNMFVSGNKDSVDNFENPADAGSYSITRTNIFAGPSVKIDVS